MKFMDNAIFDYNEKPSERKTETYPQYAGMTLEDLMLDRTEIISVGTDKGSSFIFIGTPDEYFSTQARRKVRKGNDYVVPINKELGKRTIVEAYGKLCSAEGIVAIIDGHETGRFWTKDEYDSALDNNTVTLPFKDGEKIGIHKTA